MPVLSDNSIMPFGKFKGQAMVNVPAWHLMWLHDCKHPRDEKMRLDFPEVFAYILDNEDVLMEEHDEKG